MKLLCLYLFNKYRLNYHDFGVSGKATFFPKLFLFAWHFNNERVVALAIKVPRTIALIL